MAYLGFYSGGGLRGGGPGQRSGLWGTEVPQWGPGSKPPVGGLGDKVAQKLKQNVKLVYMCNLFLHKILDLMNIRAGLGQYIL